MHMLQLSKRLQAVAELVGECSVAADVGTDHGYIPVYLVAAGKAQRAIAMDIREGPLSQAREHILQYGLEQAIEARLSDGCLGLKPREADVIVIAGMGGALMQRILMQGEEAAAAAEKLVLQPQSEIASFREFLLRQGYQITVEDMVLEDGKYYPMMAAKFLGKDAYGTVRNAGKEDIADLFESRIACKFGPLLLEQRHPVLKQYLLSQQKQKQKIQKNLKANARQNVAARTEELSRELMDIERALEFFAGKESGL